MKHLLVVALVLFTLSGPLAGKVLADWGTYGGGWSGGGGGFYSYFGW